MSIAAIQEWAKQAKEALGAANIAVDQLAVQAIDAAEHLNPRSRKAMDARRLSVYKLLLANPEGLNSFKLQKATGVRSLPLRYTLRVLEDAGLIEGVGERRSKIYRVVPQ